MGVEEGACQRQVRHQAWGGRSRYREGAGWRVAGSGQQHMQCGALGPEQEAQCGPLMN